MPPIVSAIFTATFTATFLALVLAVSGALYVSSWLLGVQGWRMTIERPQQPVPTASGQVRPMGEDSTAIIRQEPPDSVPESIPEKPIVATVIPAPPPVMPTPPRVKPAAVNPCTPELQALNLCKKGK